MARESQGLQIALVIFVMLTIVLGVTTFIFYRQATEAESKAKAATAEASKQTTTARTMTDNFNELKRYIGVAETEEREKINETFTKDMATYAGTVPEKSRFYRQSLEYLANVVKEKNAALDARQVELEKVKAAAKTSVDAAEAKTKQFEAAVGQTSQDLASEREKFKNETAKLKKDYEDLAGQLQQARKETEAKVTAAETKVQEAKVYGEKMASIAKGRGEQLNSLTKETLDSIDGHIRSVDQQTGTVYIDLGSADSLRRQVTFNVYPADASEVKKAKKKASIEVTQVLNDHLSEARIIDDNPSDPILPGDLINTPVWSPGEKQHFALAGFIDIDGDGQSDMQLIRNIISMNGGVLDCQVDEKGKRSGELTLNTRYIILGDAPEKGTREVLDAYTKIRSEAEKLGVEKITAKELLSRMGWKNQSKVVRYGIGSNPADFKAKPNENERRQPKTGASLY